MAALACTGHADPGRPANLPRGVHIKARRGGNGKDIHPRHRSFRVELSLVNDAAEDAWFIVSAEDPPLYDVHPTLQLVWRYRPDRHAHYTMQQLGLTPHPHQDPRHALEMDLKYGSVAVAGARPDGSMVSHAWTTAFHVPAGAHLLVEDHRADAPLESPGTLSIWKVAAIRLPDGSELADRLRDGDAIPIPDPPSLPMPVLQRWSFKLD